MNNSKIKAVMSEVAAEAAERDEMIHCIAIALLASKNIFILGDTGQAKSYCINGFRKHITDAKQFERIMSKQTDEEQLFGRLDLSSIIPGNMPSNELSKDVSYSVKLNEVKKAYAQYEIDGKTESLEKAQRLVKELGDIKEIICAIKEIEPKVITTGKIPDSHIVFLDEIFKSNDGILNSLLTALNERVYTNEGQTMKIPTISFFAASNEIPDFSEPENEILKPLYDRVDLKIVTEYVKEKENRQAILKQKQQSALKSNNTMITLNELYAMQNEVKLVKVSNSINEIMEAVIQDKGFYDNTGGGITLSGGEILMQADFVEELIDEAAVQNINVCLDTSGVGDAQSLKKLAAKENVTDILYDMKAIDDQVHVRYTGVSNKRILENLQMLAEQPRLLEKITMRMPLIKDINDNMEMIQKTGEFYQQLGIRKIN